MSDGDFIPPYMKEKVMNEPSKEALKIAKRYTTHHQCCKVWFQQCAREIDALREKDRAEDKKRIEELEAENDRLMKALKELSRQTEEFEHNALTSEDHGAFIALKFLADKALTQRGEDQ